MHDALHDPMHDALAAAELPLHAQDRVWSERSDDKPDVGRGLARVLRTLHRALPPGEPLRAVSVGSSTEPQRRVLHAFCEGGVRLVDVDEGALDAVRRRAARQGLGTLIPVAADYRAALADDAAAARFREEHLGGARAHLVLFHHSLYYAPFAEWPALVGSAWREWLAPTGALHAVMMAARSDDPSTTTSLYERFAGAWFGHRNDQCLRTFAASVADDPRFAGARAAGRVARVRLRAERFEDLMAVVWMVLLHPQVHRFPPEAMREIAAHVRERFFDAGVPLVQEQDHLALFRGVDGPVSV